MCDGGNSNQTERKAGTASTTKRQCVGHGCKVRFSLRGPVLRGAECMFQASGSSAILICMRRHDARQRGGGGLGAQVIDNTSH